jgi:hypothetical protein
MTRKALVVRVDQGGLANQTQQLWDYLAPDVVLLVDLPEGKRRGDSQLHRFAGRPEVIGVVSSDVIHPDLLLDVADQVDTLVTVECLYTGAPVAGTRTWQALNERCLTVLVANPELYADYTASRIVLPTTWHAARFDALVVPHPAPVEDAAPHRRARTGRARTFFHVEAPAMLDRNGTEIVAQALPHVEEPCTLIVRSHRDHRAGPLDADQIGKVRRGPATCGGLAGLAASGDGVAESVDAWRRVPGAHLPSGGPGGHDDGAGPGRAGSGGRVRAGPGVGCGPVVAGSLRTVGGRANLTSGSAHLPGGRGNGWREPGLGRPGGSW